MGQQASWWWMSGGGNDLPHRPVRPGSPQDFQEKPLDIAEVVFIGRKTVLMPK